MNNKMSDKKIKTAFFGLSVDDEKYIQDKIVRENISVEPIFFREPLGTDGTNVPASAQDAEIISVFVDCVVDKQAILMFPNLRCIATRSTGYDHIDLATASERKITVVYVPSYGENTVAEFTFGLILNISRKIGLAYDQLREEGSWETNGLLGFDLQGKTLGVVGTGRIGRHVVRIAKGFEMNVVAFDSHPDEKFSKEAGFVYLSLEKLLAESDIVTLHVPYMKETHHLIDAKALSAMKKGAYLVNTSRGAVVDTQALVHSLMEKHLAGAGLDVLEEEGVIKDELDFLAHGHPEKHNLKTVLANHALIDMPNVIVTPHNAFNTREALNRILETTVSNIENFLADQPTNIAK